MFVALKNANVKATVWGQVLGANGEGTELWVEDIPWCMAVVARLGVCHSPQ